MNNELLRYTCILLKAPLCCILIKHTAWHVDGSKYRRVYSAYSSAILHIQSRIVLFKLSHAISRTIQFQAKYGINCELSHIFVQLAKLLIKNIKVVESSQICLNYTPTILIFVLNLLRFLFVELFLYVFLTNIYCFSCYFLQLNIIFINKLFLCAFSFTECSILLFRWILIYNVIPNVKNVGFYSNF